MDKREACHRLADINECIYDAQKDLERVRLNLVLASSDERERLLEAEEELEERIDEYKREHDNFINEYYDILYS